MLPTFVIGLREGLEAALIVSIISTFLRRNGRSLRGMWVGVGAGVALSILVGILLQVVEQNLPQQEQEGMESVIGLVAVFFVTGMVLWMRTHARFLKRDLEEHAAAALKTGTTNALIAMAFLAVLREGFETAVFLLATFQGATSAPTAMLGALLGILVAVGLGWGMYKGGVRLNLQRFFSITSAFLILVAAGLVLGAFRTAHEAGWITVGQQRTVDLSWLAPNGSIRSALVSGVLGIPPDPRVIEVLAWACYLVPMVLLVYWPAKHRLSLQLAQRLRVAGAGVAVVAAAALALFVPLPSAHVSASAPVQGGGSATIAVSGQTARLTHGGRATSLQRVAPERWASGHVAGWLPDTLTLERLLGYTGQRVPIGLNVDRAPGPYDASWKDRTRLTATTHEGGLVDARRSGRLLLTLSGGGLTSPRTFTVATEAWQVAPSYAVHVQHAIAAATSAGHQRLLWKEWVPGFLLLVAVVLLLRTLQLRSGAETRASSSPDPAHTVVRQTP